MKKNYNNYQEFIKNGGEKYWQEFWQENKTNFCDLNDETKKKFYNLVMFFYPSGAKIHIGHGYNYTGSDVFGRYKRLNGFNVFEPMGYDAFGLPAENYAIKTGQHPSLTTQTNIDFGRRQLQELGLMYDWEKEINTSKSEYYKWTQWLFCVLYQAGLAYRKEAPVNWCPSCKTVLANEQVITGKCERCESEVIQKNLKQWFFKITDYADKLLEGHKKINWPEKTILMQKNWIGRSEGALVKFPISNFQFPNKSQITNSNNQNGFLEVFTTRPDTLFGATFMVVAPEHELIFNFQFSISNYDEVKKYIERAKKKSDLERTDLAKEKTGIELKGIKAINPVNGKEIPIFVADYVLPHYGTGAIMAVPAHDERDYEFAKKYNLPIVEVIKPTDINCVIVHGCPSYPENDPEKRTYDKHWIPWIKSELEKINIKTFTPLMPEPWRADYEKWKKEFDKLGINEDSILIGHSCGCAFLVRWLGETNQKIKKLILVAPWKVPDPDKAPELMQSQKAFYNYEINLNAKNNIGQVVIFTSDNEEEDGKKSAQIFYQALGGELIELKNKGHFTMGDMKTVEFPELLKKITEQVSVFTEINSGEMINSGEFNGLQPDECIKKIISWLEENGLGKREVNYRLRDWLISRQRYWGAPIPIIYCDKCGEVLDENLPVKLLELENFKPTDDGESPLARSKEFVNTKCPKCGLPAKRSTETMDTFVCSSWYFLRYLSPHLENFAFDKKLAKKWLPVDQYCGGAEHACMHLLYARFITKVLFDQGLINFDEPFLKLNHQGMILAADGAKMSKSKGNVVIPDDYVKKYGADVFRTYVLFLAPFEQGGAWNDQGIMGVKRFLEKVWNLQTKPKTQLTKNKELDILLNQTIKKVGKDIENFHFNTAISQMMILVNEMERRDTLLITHYALLVTLLSPFAPHICEELWQRLGNKNSLVFEKWPEYDKKLIQADEFELVVQINGKVRDKIMVAADISEAEAIKAAMNLEKVKKWLEGKEPKKIIYIKGKLLSIVG